MDLFSLLNSGPWEGELHLICALTEHIDPQQLFLEWISPYDLNPAAGAQPQILLFLSLFFCYLTPLWIQPWPSKPKELLLFHKDELPWVVSNLLKHYYHCLKESWLPSQDPAFFSEFSTEATHAPPLCALSSWGIDKHMPFLLDQRP